METLSGISLPAYPVHSIWVRKSGFWTAPASNSLAVLRGKFQWPSHHPAWHPGGKTPCAGSSHRSPSDIHRHHTPQGAWDGRRAERESGIPIRYYTLNAWNLNISKTLKFTCQQCFQFLTYLLCLVFKTFCNRLFEFGKILIIFWIETCFFHIPPKPFN